MSLKLNNKVRKQIIDDLFKQLSDKVGVTVTIDDVGYESDRLSLDEIDPNMLISQAKKRLPEDWVIVFFYAYGDWVAYLITNESNSVGYTVGILHLDKLVYGKEL